MLVFHDQCYEDDEDTVFERLRKDVYDEEMQRAWSLDDHVYKETSIESAKKDWMNGLKRSLRKFENSMRQLCSINGKIWIQEWKK